MRDPFEDDKNEEVEWTSKAVTASFVAAIKAKIEDEDLQGQITSAAAVNLLAIISGLITDLSSDNEDNLDAALADPGVYLK